jgi:hypothetical protein
MVGDRYAAFLERVFKLDMRTVLFAFKPAVFVQKFRDFPNRHIFIIRVFYTCVKGFFAYCLKKAGSYFLAFFAGLAGSGAAAFLGLPFPGTLRIASTTEGSYIFVLPTLRTGFIPAVRNRTLTVSKGMPRFSAISFTVSSFILPISVNLIEYLRNFKELLYIRLVKIFTENGLFILTYINRLRYIIT